MERESIFVGARFDSYEAFKKSLRLHENAKNMKFIIKDCKKVMCSDFINTIVYERVMFECNQGKMRKSESKGLRPIQRSFKLGCMAKIRLCCRRSSARVWFLEVVEANLTHDAHTPSASLQLIELRTKNYELEGKSKTQERDLTGAFEKIDNLNKELCKAKLAISKSKRAKDVEMLIQESDSLQHKLQSQEEEFRLQNQTLMGELALLVSNNEELKKELEEKDKEIDSCEENPEKKTDLDNEIRRLQAENLALQKSLNAFQQSLNKEPKSKKGNSSGQSFIEDNRQSQGHLGVDQRDSDIEEKDAEDSSLPQDDCDAVKWLKLKLDTELEEKKLLKNQLDSLMRENKETVISYQEEIQKISDKLKKKQESFLQLQCEKETAAEESSAKLEQQQASKERDQKYYKDLISKLQTELERTRQDLTEQDSSSKSQTADLEFKITELQQQVSASSVVNNHQMKEQSVKFHAEIASNKEIINLLRKEKEDLAAQLQESQHAAQVATVQVHETLVEKDRQITAIQEISKLAEKRKALVDEMAIKYQKEFDSHRYDVSILEKKRDEDVAKLEDVIAEQKKKIEELSKNIPMVEELQGKTRSLEDAKGWLERRLAEVEADLTKTVTNHQEEKEMSQSQHASKINQLTAEHLEKMETLRIQIFNLSSECEKMEQDYKAEIEMLKMTSENLRQEIKDSVSEKKIHEKKGITMLKDLKRQLHAERKRAEKLQVKLQEFLTDNQGKGVDELFRHTDSVDLLSGETSSVSSWGASASGLGKDSVASGPQSPTSANNSFVSEASVGEEYNDLLTRIASLQQDKWALEEKVHHLECSNSCMAEDLLNKASIIEHYVMDARSGRRQSNPTDDKISLKKVKDLINKNADHTQQTQEMNKKLQSMLEESLTKNMHLQQDLEMMSQEIVRLSKLSTMVAMNQPLQEQPMNNQSSLSQSLSSISKTDPITVSTSLAIEVESFCDEKSSTTNADEERVASPTDTKVSDGNFEMISSSELDNVKIQSLQEQQVYTEES